MLAAVLLACAAFAQPADKIKEEMNAIKLDEGYLYAEANAGDEDSAFRLAVSELADKIRGDCASCGIRADYPLVIRSNARRLARRLGFARGSGYRIMVYLPKDLAMSLAENSALAKGLVASAAPGGGRRSGGSHSGGSHSGGRAGVTPVTPLNEQPLTGGEEEELHAASAGAKPAQQPTTQPVQPSSAPVTPQPASKYASVNASLLKVGDALELRNFLDYYKDSGVITSYSRARSLDDIPADAYRILVKGGEHTVSAILSPAGVNVDTGSADALTNYHGHYIIWYK